MCKQIGTYAGVPVVECDGYTPDCQPPEIPDQSSGLDRGRGSTSL